MNVKLENNVDPIESTGDVDGDSQTNDTNFEDRIAELEAELASANGQAAKYKKLARDAQQQRDNAKKNPVQTDENYKELWDTANTKLTATLERVKNADINNALLAQLTKAGVDADWASAAGKLADRSMIEWDEDIGVDAQSITGAVAKLKAEYPAMFGKAVKGVNPKNPVNGSSDNKTLTREEFSRLQPLEQSNRMKTGWTIVD